MKISTVHAVQDDLGVKTPGVYSISFECCYFCIGWIVKYTETRVKKHCQLIQLGQLVSGRVHIQPRSSNPTRGHQNLLHQPGCVDQFISKALVMEFHPNNMNRENGVILHGSWELLILSLREHRSYLQSG